MGAFSPTSCNLVDRYTMGKFSRRRHLGPRRTGHVQPFFAVMLTPDGETHQDLSQPSCRHAPRQSSPFHPHCLQWYTTLHSRYTALGTLHTTPTWPGSCRTREWSVRPLQNCTELTIPRWSLTHGTEVPPLLIMAVLARPSLPDAGLALCVCS